jgi:flagellar hook-length control protein FliK
MLTATKNSSTEKSFNIGTNLVTKYTSKLDNSETTSKGDYFQDILNSKYETKDTTEAKYTDTNKVDEVEDDFEELEEDSKSSSKDEIDDVLSQLMNLLNQLGINSEDLESGGEEINSGILKTIIEGINENTGSNNNFSSTMDNLIKLLQTDSIKDALDNDLLNGIEKNLNSLSSNLSSDNTKSISDIKDIIAKMLNKDYSQDNNDSSTKNDSNNATDSKEDKFLNSLINDDKDSSSNKINLFELRTQAIQNQSVDTVKELTVNKATFTSDLIKDVQYMSNNGLKELTVKVNPGNLGEITINLVEEDGIMKANLKANSKETAAILAQNLAEIKTHLNEQNIKIADVNIELYQEDTTFFSGEGFDSQFSQEQEKNSNTRNDGSGQINIEDSLSENIQNINEGNINFLV